MKFATSTSIAIFTFSSIHAQFEDYNTMPSDYAIGGVDERKLLQTWNMLYHIEPSFQREPDARRFLLKHGCYCHAMGASAVGSRNGYHGPPLDELDALCRDLWRSQKCMNHEESDADNENCPIDAGYPWDDVLGDNGEPEVACGRSENDRWMKRDENQCDIKVCELEKEFAFKVKDLIASGYVKNPQFHTIQDGEYEAFCPSSEFPEARDEYACCGEGLSRRPFDSVSKQCCADRITEIGSC